MREKIELKVAATNVAFLRLREKADLSREAEKTIREALMEIKL